MLHERFDNAGAGGGENSTRPKLTSPVPKYEKHLKDLIPLKQPLRILIDPCNICNFRCEFCFQSNLNSPFAGTVMSEEIFDEVLKSLSEFDEPINVVHMYGLGEPLTNKNLPNFISRLKKSGRAKKISVTTNGSLLNENLSQSLIDAGIDRIQISLNGLCDEDFARIVHRKISFDELYRQIKYLYEIRGNCHLHVKINGECFSSEDREKFVALFQNFADTINIDHVANFWSGIEIPGAEKNLNVYGLNYSPSDDFVCYRTFYEMMINADGNVSPCCIDYKFHEQSLGNIKNFSLKEIWTGKKLRQLQLCALKGETSPYKICNGCEGKFSDATTDITPYREEILNRLKGS